MSIIEKFLSRNSVFDAGELPLIHSAQSVNLKSFKSSGKIVASKCKVFKNEKLNYFFVGRPAYKRRASKGKSEYWELPCCFIFDFDIIKNAKRVYPFDSGAFLKGLYPSYIRGMSHENFDLASVHGGVSKLIGAYFGTVSSYFSLDSKSKSVFEREHALGVFDEELKALHKLSLEDQASTFDDRRFTIEVQSESDIDLMVSKPLAVIAPYVYFEDVEFREHVTNVWGAQPIGYNMFPLNVNAYYSQIYALVEAFYRKKGLL